MILPVFLLIGILIRIDRIRTACECFCHAEQRVFCQQAFIPDTQKEGVVTDLRGKDV